MRIVEHAGLDEFVGECVNNLLAWDVIVLLHRNMNRRFTVREVAEILGRPPAEVASVVSCLRSRAMLSAGSPFSATALFHDNASMFTAALEDKQERLRILSRVLAKQSGLSISA